MWQEKAKKSGDKREAQTHGRMRGDVTASRHTDQPHCQQPARKQDLSSASAVKRIWPVPEPINSETDSVPKFQRTLQSAQSRERVS